MRRYGRFPLSHQHSEPLLRSRPLLERLAIAGVASLGEDRVRSRRPTVVGGALIGLLQVASCRGIFAHVEVAHTEEHRELASAVDAPTVLPKVNLGVIGDFFDRIQDLCKASQRFVEGVHVRDDEGQVVATSALLPAAVHPLVQGRRPAVGVMAPPNSVA